MTTENMLYGSIDEMLADDMSVYAGRPLKNLLHEIQELYLHDDKPWVIGFSGGKDSTTILSLIYTALLYLESDQLHKHIYVVSSDTLVETPVVVDQIKHVIDAINTGAKAQGLPISAHQVFPKTNETFWVNLLGKGYPAPTTSFRWCTERMKIDPVSEFIMDKVARFGEVIVVLGSRSQESSSRAQVIAKHKIDGSLLSRHSSLPGAFTYMPIESWTHDEVWMYLLSTYAPWGGTNRELFDLYKGSNSGECPLVIDTSTPSCGNSRFGCWTCTVVTKDKAIEGLIENGATWMDKLLVFRQKLWDSTKPENKEELRNKRRRDGRISYVRSRNVNEDGSRDIKRAFGPYKMIVRQEWLEELLTIERDLRANGHDIELITRSELHAIRIEWLHDPLDPDWTDHLPAIYRRVYGEDLDWVENDAGAFTKPDADLLKELEEQHQVPAELIMKLIELELSMEGLSVRRGLLRKMESLLEQDWDADNSHDYRIESLRKLDSYDKEMNELRTMYEELTKKEELA
ncbi:MULTISPECIES: DNA phosphorothioation system sulfurtransferase DndC [unclassified Endozoicomonas]|uniref:DNA phosphorothioation system sulfurtransferase DndC n=1 Tax=unclassified Endozoicomonas TaxID=2644528 RepID=UPI003BB72C66